MELIRCHIDNFGVLCGQTINFSGGLNAFCLENGQGKSTLCAFLKCMLYGLSDSRRRDLSDNERKHYMPWQGGTFGGSLTLRFEGQIYRIARSFGARPAEDRLEVYNEQTGELTRALGTCPGETMLGMDAQGFASCALFSERAFSLLVENESILSLLGSEENEKSGSLAAALSRLESERKLYEKRGGHGLVAETDGEISRLTERQASLMQTAEALPQKEAEFLRAKAELSALTESEGKRFFSSFGKTQKKKKRHLRALSFLISVLILLLSFLIGYLAEPKFYLGAFFALPFLFLAFHRKKRNNSLQNGKIKTKNSEIFEQRYRACAACERAYEEAMSAAEEVSYLAVQIENLKKKRERFAWELSDIKKTIELLSRVGKDYRESRTDSTRKGFAEHLHALGEKHSERYRLGDHFSPSFLQGNDYHTAEVLSRGERDRVSLARSLSLLSAMPGSKRPPLLLDDPFLSYDDKRLSQALSALSVLAEDFQIVYLSCSHSRMP